MAYSWPTCLVLVWLSIACLPYSIARVILHWSSIFAEQTSRSKRVALVTGGRAQKAVYVTRALSRQGYRVILAEERGWGEVCATRFSRSIARFYALPNGGGDAYVDALRTIARRESINLFVPCSGVATAIEEAEAARWMRKEGIETIIQDADLLSTLHEKDTFMRLVHELGMDGPKAHFVRSSNEGLRFLQEQSVHENGRRFLFKAATVPDDIGRADMTTYPLLGKDGKVDWHSTEARLRGGLHIPITPKTPYLAQEFIGSQGASEWCTHATVIDGIVTAFVCCPSNDMLMTYHNATHTFIGHRALRWTQTFLDNLAKHPSWHSTRLTGQFSFDFIYLPDDDRLVVIECNPRVHTAICLLQHDSRLGAALDGSVQDRVVLLPNLHVEPVSWLGHDLVVVPRWRVWHTRQDSHAFDLNAIGVDGAWLASDPIVFLAFYHVQWPILLLRQAFIRQIRFSRINISTARIFEYAL